MRSLLFFVEMGTALIATGCAHGGADTASRSGRRARRPRRRPPTDRRPKRCRRARRQRPHAADVGGAPRRGCGDHALLDAGADVEARDARHGWTALQNAVHTQRIDAVRVLLDRAPTPMPGRIGVADPAAHGRRRSRPGIVKRCSPTAPLPVHQGEWCHDTRPAVSGGHSSTVDRPARARLRAESSRPSPDPRWPARPSPRSALAWRSRPVAGERHRELALRCCMWTRESDSSDAK